MTELLDAMTKTIILDNFILKAKDSGYYAEKEMIDFERAHKACLEAMERIRNDPDWSKAEIDLSCLQSP